MLSYFTIEEMMVLLDYRLDYQVYWLLSGKGLGDGLHVVSSDDETVIMKQLADKVKNFVLYFDHHNYIGSSAWEDVHNQPEFYNNVEDKAENVVNASDSDDSIDDPNFIDSDYDVEDGDDDIFFDNVDEHVIDEGVAKGKKIEKGKKVVNRYEDDVSPDDDVLEVPDSDEEGDVRKNLKSFNPEVIANPIFKLGMMFDTVEQLRVTITEYSLKNRVEIKTLRNNKSRVEAHCADGSPWRLVASHDNRFKCFMIKTYFGEHNCQKKWVLKRCTARWLAEKYLDAFKTDEKITLKSFTKTIQLQWNLTPSRTKLGRARSIALKTIYGDEVHQFNQLWDYGHELRRSNPGIDPNDYIFPIIVIVVKVESLVTWMWFLETLKEDLGIDNTYPWIIMTYKQKGLIPVVQKVFPEAEHRFCVRHLYSNFQVHFKGENLKNQLWACARSSTVAEWNANMEVMKSLNTDAHEWLEKMPPNTWVKMRDKWVGNICPKIKKKVGKNADMANTCYVLLARQGVFQVQGMGRKYIVELNTKHYDCRRWDLTVLPPKYEKRIGRPPKSRRKAPHEVQGKNGPKFSKHGGAIRCNYCRDIGHNATTCEHKKAGRPPRQQPMEPMPQATCIDITDGPTPTQEMGQPDTSASHQLMSQMSNTMVSQMVEQASQSRRQ
ncbi:hypothetical protein QOZ80_4AG0308850 [Eleusine coracana subsp. coracana]|nr:hypothetical protein QOZ80_4AG0308850 [Eleusine coracana subsp. coracana]